ncbi:amino acid permease [Planosporangium thailandense]|uniref:Amino acid permease n=1 Tax=Planosporangium thailandense TaxID=765197 RepID=A0ABX0Y2X5_9ACTN|nr:amino acid permease [Planosporangium thailandense]
MPVNGADVPESVGYQLKRRLLGRPLVTASLHEERLSKPLALGVLAPDCISSSAYGTEEMLIELLPAFGLLAFSLVLPITGIILVIGVLMTVVYREVVQVYTKAGGSYVVARDNFGPRVAQVAAVALLIDYVVTVAVQAAAGTVAVASAFPVIGPYSLEITVGVVVLIAFGNLRGIREAGRVFALPTYLFSGSIAAVIVVGLVREVFGTLPRYDPTHLPGAVDVHHVSGLALGMVVLTLLRSFANGGSSLTGLEAISNGVSAFRSPEGVNARKVLVMMAGTLGFLVAGVSWLAHVTHATPYASGYPSVISQEARIVFGHGAVGNALYLVVQASSALILYTGANTSFNGFPFLASFVAEDSFLPRQLTRRGHRLVFSNGIIVLTAVSVALLLVTGAKVNSLVPFYAIGVFTGFTMAGFGMATYYRTHRGRGWRPKAVIGVSGGTLSALIVLIFAVVKFAEGAWLVVVIFPILVFVLIRLNGRYRRESDALATLAPIIDTEPNPACHVVLVLVDDLDLATLRTLRYARSLRPDRIRAVHFVIDNVHAERLADRWRTTQRGDIALELLDCPDRRIRRAALELTARTAAAGNTEVTVVLPRRTYPGVVGRLLHDRTADRIAAVISRVPHAAATIVPFDVDAAITRLKRLPFGFAHAGPQAAPGVPEPNGSATAPDHPPTATGRRSLAAPGHPDGVVPVAALRRRIPATVEGTIRSVRVQPMTNSHVLECEVVDDTGGLLLRFYGRGTIPGIQPGRRIRVHGTPGSQDGTLAICNPRYELLDPERHP